MFVLVLSGTATLLLSVHGCGPLERVEGSSSKVPDAGVPDATWGLPCPMSRPEGVPEAWELMDELPCCGFYRPTTAAQLPPRLRWASCDFSIVACREVATDWDVPGFHGTNITATARRVWAHPDGTVTIMQSRNVRPRDAVDDRKDWTLSLIADADGAVQQALLQARPETCVAVPEDIGDGYYAYKVNGGPFLLAGQIANSFGPRGLSLKWKRSVFWDAVGSPGVVRLTDRAISLHPWKTPDQEVTLEQFPEKGYVDYRDGLPVFNGSTIFWQSGLSTIKTFREGTGTRDFISSASGNGAASDFGTDGKDMVWIHLLGVPTGNLLTSPHTEDATQVNRRRIRSEIPNGLPAIVGCGYMARLHDDGIRIVRLADGSSWDLSEDRYGLLPLGITCDEVFLQYSHRTSDASNVARIRLDSLGPGLPPD